MDSKSKTFTTVDEYIALHPKAVQKKLKELRAAIKSAAPQAVEKISYQMPAYALHGNLVYFGAYKTHIGFYPAPRGIEAFKDQLAKYEGAKGTVKFPLDKPLPLALIKKIVKFRAAENMKKAEGKKKR